MPGTDNPDHAERDAYFPSKKSVSGSPRTTDYDGPEFDALPAGQAGRILMIGTEERYLPIKGGVLFSTGNHPIETLVPLLHLTTAGFDIDVATLTGALMKFEYWAFPDDDDNVIAIYNAMREQFRQPLVLSEVVKRGLDRYDAVYLPGGHGAMLGLPHNHDVQRVLRWVQENNSTLISICHGPAALAAGGLDGAKNPFAGYDVVAYPDEVDKGPSIESGYLPGEMEWYVSEALAPQGITVLNHDVSGATHRDRNLLSGDSPQAANALGHLATRYLTGK